MEPVTSSNLQANLNPESVSVSFIRSDTGSIEYLCLLPDASPQDVVDAVTARLAQINLFYAQLAASNITLTVVGPQTTTPDAPEVIIAQDQPTY